MQQALIKLKNGTEYLTPVENLDNVKRMLAGQYNDIEFPGWEDDLEGEEINQRMQEDYNNSTEPLVITSPAKNKGGRPKKATN